MSAVTEMPAPGAQSERGRFRCRHCLREFSRETYCVLHMVRQHNAGLMDPRERALYDDAVLFEEVWVADLRKHAKALMRVLPFLFFAFVVVAIGISAEINMAFMVLVLPPSLVAVGVLYFISYESG